MILITINIMKLMLTQKKALKELHMIKLTNQWYNFVQVFLQVFQENNIRKLEDNSCFSWFNLFFSFNIAICNES